MDTLEEPVQGTFYEQELPLSVQEIFRIERVLRKKKNQVYVVTNYEVIILVTH